MQVPVFGIIIILLSLLFSLKRKWFIYWFVFSNSLHYTTVIALGKTSIIPFHINILLMFILYVRGNIFKKNALGGKDSAYILLFVAWIFISYFLSFFLGNNIEVLSSGTSYRDYDHLSAFRPTLDNATQIIFPLFGVFSFLVIKAFIKSYEDIKVFVKAYLISFIPLFITVAALFIFRNVMHNSLFILVFFKFINVTFDRQVSSSDYNSIGDIARTFTYVGEPSYTAKYYIILMSILISFLFYKKNTAFRKYSIIFLLVLLFAMILILGSTTGYAGFFILMLIALFLFFRYSSAVNKQTLNANRNFLFTNGVMLFIIVIPVCLIFINQIAFFFNYVQAAHLDKIEGDTGSGVTRYNTLLVALNVFLKTPIFGVGYGNNRSNSFFAFLLSNVGIVGFALINLFCIYLIFKPLHVLKSMPEKLRPYCIMFVTIFSTAYIIYFAFASNVTIIFGWFWTNAALIAKFCKWQSLVPEESEELALTNNS